eukprot:2506097-Karenia_brevis.AAC.1
MNDKGLCSNAGASRYAQLQQGLVSTTNKVDISPFDLVTIADLDMLIDIRKHEKEESACMPKHLIDA